MYEPLKKFKVNRELNEGIYNLTELFKGLEHSFALKDIFKEGLKVFLKEVKVLLVDSRGYMRVSEKDGSIILNLNYLKKGDLRYLYLDIIHELLHVKQFKEGKELYDSKYSYVDRLTEIEAYKVVLKEAKRLGMSKEEIEKYLKVEWISEEEFKRLLKHIEFSK
ncbi:MAG: hypothetical protein QXX95_05280 [Nitrososphaerales archaeon]